MGYEAYKLEAKFQNLKLSDITNALRENGALLIETFGGSVTMEIIKATGVIELVLRESGSVNTRFSPGEKVLLSVRFAKVSDVHLLNDVITLLKKLAAKFDAIYIRDHETGRDIDLNDTAWLSRAVMYAKYDFEYYFPIKGQPARCRDVFGLCGGELPQAVMERII
jgi:hypothetical protein